MYLLRQFISECETRDRFLAPEGVPLPATVRSLGQEDPLKEGMAPIPIFSPWESHGQRSLADYSLEGHRESGTAEEKARVLSEKSESAGIDTVQYCMIPLHIKFHRKGSGWLFHGGREDELQMGTWKWVILIFSAFHLFFFNDIVSKFYLI